MAKRFIETSLPTNTWFQDLTTEQKLFWVYLQLTCDHAGIWQVNWRTVKFHLGIEPQDPLAFGLAIKVLSASEWYLMHFVEEQQGVPPGKLNPKNSCHASIIKILNNKNILSPSVGPVKALGRGYSNGNGKTQLYATPMDNIGNMETIRIEDLDNIRDEASKTDFTTPEWTSQLQSEVADFRNIGFKDPRIKELFLTRAIPEHVIDKVLGKNF